MNIAYLSLNIMYRIYMLYLDISRFGIVISHLRYYIHQFRNPEIAILQDCQAVESNN